MISLDALISPAQFEKMVAPYIDKAPEYLQNFVFALLIFFVGRLIAQMVKKISIRVMRRSKVDETLVGFGSSLGYFGMLALVVVAAINQLGIETTSFVAILGAAGLAIGLALQGSLSNFAAGALMIIFKPIKVGDTIDGAGVSGEVVEISIFTTVLKTGDNKKIIVPNSKLSNDNIVNYSAFGTRRLDIALTVSYDAKLDQVKSLLKTIIAEDSRIVNPNDTSVGVQSLTESGAVIVMRPWVSCSEYGALQFDLNQKIKETFEKNGISMAPAQREVKVTCVQNS